MTELWSVTGSIPVEVEVLSHSEYLVSDPVSRTATIKIETEPVQEKQFILQTTFTGTIPDGYAPETVTLSPQYLTLKGPESLIGQISKRRNRDQSGQCNRGCDRGGDSGILRCQRQ